MLHIHELETEKYVQKELDKWAKDIRKDRNRKAIQDFTTFLAGIGMMAIGIYVVGQMPQWIPHLKRLVNSVSY